MEPGEISPVRQGDKWGYRDARGQIAIAARFDSAGIFSEGLAGVRVGDKWGFIDASGEMALPAQFDQVRPFMGGYAKVKQGDRWGYIDRKGFWMEVLTANTYIDDEGRFVSEQEYRDWEKPPRKPGEQR